MRAGGAAVVVGVGCVVAQLDSSQIEPTAAIRAKRRVVCMTDSLVIFSQSYSVFSNCGRHGPWRGNLIVRGHNSGTGRSNRWRGDNRKDAEIPREYCIARIGIDPCQSTLHYSDLISFLSNRKSREAQATGRRQHHPEILMPQSSHFRRAGWGSESELRIIGWAQSRQPGENIALCKELLPVDRGEGLGVLICCALGTRTDLARAPC